jgi:hypothetical protein
MRKRNHSIYFDKGKEGEQGKDRDFDRDFSGPGVTEFSIDLNSDQLRNMSPEELEMYLRKEARKRLHKK